MSLATIVSAIAPARRAASVSSSDAPSPRLVNGSTAIESYRDVGARRANHARATMTSDRDATAELRRIFHGKRRRRRRQLEREVGAPPLLARVQERSGIGKHSRSGRSRLAEQPLPRPIAHRDVFRQNRDDDLSSKKRILCEPRRPETLLVDRLQNPVSTDRLEGRRSHAAPGRASNPRRRSSPTRSTVTPRTHSRSIP